MSKFASIAVVAGSITVVWIGCSSGQGSPDSLFGSGGNGNATGSGETASNGSASNGSAGTGSGPSATPLFETDIIPIFNKSCGTGDSACHSRIAYAADKASACRGWLALEDMPLGSRIYGGPDDGKPTGCPDLPLYERLTQLDAWQECNGALKKWIAPCDVDGSYLFNKIDKGPYCDIAPNVPSEPMPKGKIMDPTERETIRAWIVAGAPRKDGTGVKCGGGTEDGGPGDAGVGQPPKAQINHPGDMEKRPANMPIPFIGVGTDPEDGDLSGASLVWTSNLTGTIGTGKQFNAPLTVGTHVITLTVTDKDKNSANASLTLYIQ
jgi:hypothetical protein